MESIENCARFRSLKYMMAQIRSRILEDTYRYASGI